MADLILSSTREGVTTLTMNNPQRLNGWTGPMMEALRGALGKAATDPETKALILTGSGRYYCAGVNLGATIKLGHPKELHAFIVEHNQALFDMFIEFPKPILIAANGPAIGAPVTSATLCDGIIASTQATFSTPFAKLGVPPEGCSSVMFPRLLGEHASRMLGPEGFAPAAEQAKDIGLINWVAEPDQLMTRAFDIAKEWIDQGKKRSYRAGATREELKAVNARESVQVADAFLSPPFLHGQFKFLWGKNKRVPALTFLALRMTHPLWSRLL